VTTEQQIKALAELDGWTLAQTKDPKSIFFGKGFRSRYPFLRTPKWEVANTSYLTSYDAIIPLIQKQSDDIKGKIDMDIFELGYNHSFDPTPAQLCEALLRATEKWKD